MSKILSLAFHIFLVSSKIFSQNGNELNIIRRNIDLSFEKSFEKHYSLPINFNHSDATKKESTVKLNPLFDITYLYNSKDRDLISSRQGVRTECFLNKKVYGNLAVYNHLASFSNITLNLVDSLEFFPKYGADYFNSDNIFSTINIRGNLRYRPFEFLTFSVGTDKHFFGNGHRSLFLSDNSGAYPFFLTSLKIWHIQYISITTFLKDIYYESDKTFSYKRQYGTLHYISWNITPSINLNLFEAVMWRGSDSALYNGMNINYLNPVIFMRPVEYAQGSTDNALLGAGLNLRLFSRFIIYSQACIDEFYIKEIKNKGYRDNKFGYQAGIRGDYKSVKWLFEINQVRPFTYSHYHSLQNYGHVRQPLAHPLGANFREMITQIFYTKDKLYGLLQLGYSHYGKDSPASFHGNDVYKNYWDVDRFGHYLFDGVDVKRFNSIVRLGYYIKKEWDMALETGIVFQKEKTAIDPVDYTYFFVGLKTLFYNDEWFE